MNTPLAVSRCSLRSLPKQSLNRTPRIVQTLAVALMAMSLTATARAAEATFSTTAPTLGPIIISNLIGHVVPTGSGDNALESNVNDPRYIGADQAHGQTFKTGSNTNGYLVTAVTLKTVTYPTFIRVPGINYIVRIIRPLTTNTLSVLATETAEVSEDYANCATCNFYTHNSGNSQTEGTGRYITFTLDTPVLLATNTTYGFDVGVAAIGEMFYWELDGRDSDPQPGPGDDSQDPYTNGMACSSDWLIGSNNLTNKAGDRVFVVALTPANVPVPPRITRQPESTVVYSGRLAQFTAKAAGSTNLVYRWQKNGTNLSNVGNISGALTDSLTISNVSAGDVGSYALVVTNSANSTNSSTVTLSVVVPPPAGTSYAYHIYTNNALAYWRLNETSDPATTPPAYDYVGGRIGTYETLSQNGFNTIPGPRPSPFPGFESTNYGAQSENIIADSWVTVPALYLNTNRVTFTAWIYPNGPQPDWVGFFRTDAGATHAGMGYGSSFWGSQGHLNYMWNYGATRGFVSGLVIPEDQWSFVAVVIEPDKATLYLGTGGSLTNRVNSIPHINELWNGKARIGGDAEGNFSTFNGTVDEVAVFKRSLTFDQINTLYGVGRGIVQPVAPVIDPQPRSQALYAGRTARFQAPATGSSPLVYRWRKNGTNLNDGGNISGALTDSLTITNVAASNAGAYTLVVTNSVGAVTSAPPATLTLVSPSGKAYEAAVRSANPVAYWRLNETGDPMTNNTVAYDYWGGFAGIYEIGALNGFNNIPGPRPGDFPEFEADNTALESAASTDQSWVTVPPLNLNTNTVTITAWIHPKVDPIGLNAGLFFTRQLTTIAGLHYTTDNQIGYTWNGGSSETRGFHSELRPPLNQWSFVAVVIDGPNTNAALYLCNTNGLASTNNAIPHTSEAWDGSARIGDDEFIFSTPFDGIIDDVAVFNYAFTPAQILNLCNSAFQLPVILSIQKVGANVQLTWPQGTLLEANLVTGPYTTNSATSPYLFAPTGAAKFFRVKVQ